MLCFVKAPERPEDEPATVEHGQTDAHYFKLLGRSQQAADAPAPIDNLDRDGDDPMIADCDDEDEDGGDDDAANDGGAYEEGARV